MDFKTTSFYIHDLGGRRSGHERRRFSYTEFIPERRSGKNRRNGQDRRNGLDAKTNHLQSEERRIALLN